MKIQAIDAMGCQKKIIRLIADKGADYVIALKAINPTCIRTLNFSSRIIRTTKQKPIRASTTLNLSMEITAALKSAGT